MVFISYSSSDVDYAEKVKLFCENNRLACWYAPISISAGEDHGSMISDAIANCKCVVLILSAQSQMSPWVKKEVKYAISKRKPIIPLHIDECELDDHFSYLLTDCQCINAQSWPLSANAYFDLLSQLQQWGCIDQLHSSTFEGLARRLVAAKTNAKFEFRLIDGDGYFPFDIQKIDISNRDVYVICDGDGCFVKAYIWGDYIPFLGARNSEKWLGCLRLLFQYFLDQDVEPGLCLDYPDDLSRLLEPVLENPRHADQEKTVDQFARYQIKFLQIV